MRTSPKRLRELADEAEAESMITESLTYDTSFKECARALRDAADDIEELLESKWLLALAQLR